MTTITKQPYLKCCANCKHFNEGYDGWHKCLNDFKDQPSVDATDICEKYDQREGEVR
jgi:hypothetical protein